MKSHLKKVYLFFYYIKNFFYDWGFADQLKLPVPVISIGNLTVGGSGKTPFVDLVLTHLEAQGVKVGVVSRNYKAPSPKSGRVDIHASGAEKNYGDEPVWLAQRHPHSPIYVGPSKWLSAWKLYHEFRPAVILVDDGFQHRALHRDLDVVLVDSTEKLSDFSVIPEGRGREPLSALRRASWVVFTKSNWSSPGDIEKWKSCVGNSMKWGVTSSHLKKDFVPQPEDKAIAFCGLASPDSFKTSLQHELGCPVVDFIAFPDHHNYQNKDLDKIKKSQNHHQAQWIVTTEKDWIKVSTRVSSFAQFQPIALETIWEQGGEEFYADLAQIIR